MIWSHNSNWMITGDDGGIIKYWQSNMNNFKAFQAHKEAVRDLSFCPTDLKFASCSDDVTLKIWDFAKCQEEHTLTGKKIFFSFFFYSKVMDGMLNVYLGILKKV